MTYGTCADVEKLAGRELGHCISCHEDIEYGYDMIWIDLPDGREAHVCCDVALVFDNLPLDQLDGARPD